MPSVGPVCSRKTYLQIGCGWCAPAGWINFDSSPTLRFERIPLIGRLYTKNEQRFPRNVRFGDVTKGLPVPDGSYRGVYASHVLEHLSRHDFEIALKEVFRILAPDGTFRLVVPDLEIAAANYLSALKSSRLDANDEFLRTTSLGMEKRPRSPIDFLKLWLGGSAHLWMWDYPSLTAKLAEHGFDRIRRAGFNDCEDLRFQEVEQRERFEEAVAVEARKPT